MTDRVGVPRPSDEEAIDLLAELVGICSPSTQEGAAVKALVGRMRGLGFEAEVDAAGSAVGRLGAGEKHLLLLGHIDTVPGEIPVRREGNVLHGRGAVDAKGPLATFVAASARATPLANIRVTVVGAVEEECATSAGAYHVVNTHEPADWVVIGEPSGWRRITLGYKGRLLIDYALTRAMSHTAGREIGVCEQAVGFWSQIVAWAKTINQGKERAFDRLDPSLRSICSASDGLEERVDMQIGLRLPPGLDVDELRRLCDGWRASAAVSTRGHELPYRAEKRNALTSAFLSSIRAEGDRAAFVTKTGTSDMNVIGPRWKRPIVAYGPGDSGLDHTPEERIDLDEYLAAIRVLTRVIRRLDERCG